MKYLRLLALIFALLVLVHLLNRRTEVQSESMTQTNSRSIWMKKNIDMANEGFYFQMAPGLPSESNWQDQGMALLIHPLAAIKRYLGWGPIDFDVIYKIEFSLLTCLMLFFFFPWAKQLPVGFLFLIPFLIFHLWQAQYFFFSWNLYWASSLAAYWAIMGIVLLRHDLANELPRQNFVGSFLKYAAWGFLASFILLFRREAGILTIVSFFTCGVLWTAVQTKYFRLMTVILLGMILGASAPPLIRDCLYSWRDRAYPISSEVRKNPRHPLWAPLYLGLGYVENDLGIEWKDEIGEMHVRRRFGDGVVYASEDYEQKVKQLYFETISENPKLLFKSVIAKLKYLLTLDRIWILGLSVLCMLSLFLLPKILVGFVIVELLFSMAIPLLTHPDLTYSLVYVSSLRIWFFVMAVWLFYALRLRFGNQ